MVSAAQAPAAFAALLVLASATLLGMAPAARLLSPPLNSTSTASQTRPAAFCMWSHCRLPGGSSARAKCENGKFSGAASISSSVVAGRVLMSFNAAQSSWLSAVSASMAAYR
jgi:hypothetical protein